ncbi:MAG: hypothetical protein ACKOJE_06140, partial [Bacteroidota bacterium]
MSQSSSRQAACNRRRSSGLWEKSASISKKYRYSLCNPHLDAEGLESGQPELEQEIQLRPKTFGDFAGQDKVMDNLKVFVAAALGRGEALDHV